MSLPYPKRHPTGQAYIRWDGRTKYFGKFGTPAADKGYLDWRNRLDVGSTAPVSNLLVIDLFTMYEQAHPTKSYKDRLKAIRTLGELAGIHCHEYGPLRFRQHRALLASTGSRCARHVNDLMQLVQRIFRWGVSMEKVPLEVYTKLKLVDPLKAHEVKHQSKKRTPARREDVEKTLAELHPMPAAIVRLLLLTGARPGEICKLRASETSKNGPYGVWVNRPLEHKTQHHGKRKFIVFGPKSITILKEHWPTVGDWFFPAVQTVGHYRPDSLYQAVKHATERAGVPMWSPYQLRHLKMTEVTVEKGLDAAALLAGHSETKTTLAYTHEPSREQLDKAI